ncbi:MAG TPA: hypothetical protein VN026_11640 [Bacteroidia bacterium]|nr:hypothetical protein [Bacteroidia bacterium]
MKPNGASVVRNLYKYREVITIVNVINEARNIFTYLLSCGFILTENTESKIKARNSTNAVISNGWFGLLP